MRTVARLHLALLLALAASTACAEPLLFLRKTTLTNGTVQLETCIRRYQPAAGNGPEVLLVSVAHLGDSNYFAAIQRRLNAQGLVFFEGVGARQKGALLSRTNATPASGGGQGMDLTAFQTKLADTLGLVFQLGAIDYSPTNFRNCDLPLSRLREQMRGQSLDPDKFARVLAGQDDSLKPLMAFLTADAATPALVKTVLVEALADVGNDIESLSGLDPELGKLMKVILTDRNEIIFGGLKAELAKPRPPASIAMFYGAGHMKELAARLESELHYQPAGEEWLPAFGVNPEAAGVNSMQLGMIRSAIQTLKQMKRSSPAPATAPAEPAK